MLRTTSFSSGQSKKEERAKLSAKIKLGKFIVKGGQPIKVKPSGNNEKLFNQTFSTMTLKKDKLDVPKVGHSRGKG